MVLTDLAISKDRLQVLLEELQSDFSAQAGGFSQLEALEDSMQRAVVSDQICQSTFAIAENLVEARLHQQELASIIGPEGLTFPTKVTAAEAILRGAQMDMAITGCVRAMGSVLDCLAATAIGVLRMPLSINSASFGLLKGFSIGKRRVTPLRQQAWSDWKRLVHHHEEAHPEGWMQWLMAMRNLNIHRGRQVHTLVQRQEGPDRPPIFIVGEDQDPQDLELKAARFDLHLRNRPQLPDMVDFLTSRDGADLWISESATTTLSGLFALVNDLVEEACHFLLAWWRKAGESPDDFPPPREAWRLDEASSFRFCGISGVTTRYPVDRGYAGPHLAERLRLVESLQV